MMQAETLTQAFLRSKVKCDNRKAERQELLLHNKNKAI